MTEADQGLVTELTVDRETRTDEMFAEEHVAEPDADHKTIVEAAFETTEETANAFVTESSLIKYRSSS